jgi:hypothetical protein
VHERSVASRTRQISESQHIHVAVKEWAANVIFHSTPEKERKKRDGQQRQDRSDWLATKSKRRSETPGRARNSPLGRLALNQFNGTLPAELGSLTGLNLLNLEQNGLSGPLPKELALMVLLRSLRLSANALTGTIPSELGRLPLLEELELGDNALEGSLPPPGMCELMMRSGTEVCTNASLGLDLGRDSCLGVSPLRVAIDCYRVECNCGITTVNGTCHATLEEELMDDFF